MPELTEGPGGPAGYARLVERYALNVVPNWHESFVAVSGVRRESIGPDGSVQKTYIPVYWPGDSDFDHLEFAGQTRAVLDRDRALAANLVDRPGQ